MWVIISAMLKQNDDDTTLMPEVRGQKGKCTIVQTKSLAYNKTVSKKTKLVLAFTETSNNNTYMRLIHVK